MGNTGINLDLNTYRMINREKIKKYLISTLGDWRIGDERDAELVAGGLDAVLLGRPIDEAVVHLVDGERDAPLLQPRVRVSEPFL
jgi:hypothetical protein